ncbi:MAG: PstS family phosphate ABC transporter substrate-binding protein [Clostridiaceae bacterium]|nr:PstS family phosphate ABC transporter substrate-binding protein [Clostridiaceae bacterium]
MKKLAILLILVMVTTAGLIGCGSNQVEEPANTAVENDASDNTQSGNDVDFSRMIQVRGSDTMVNLGQQWAEAFMDKYPEAQIAVTGGGSGTGIAAIINGTADMAQSSRKMRDAEMQQARDNGFELEEFIVGLDGLAVATHASNDIEALTMEELKGIFTGTITNWKEVGGHDAPISVMSRESNSGTHVYFKENVMDDEEFHPNTMLMPSTQAIVEGLMQDENAIGYLGLGYASDEINVLSVKMDADSDAVYPTDANVSSGAYPIARPLFVYTAGKPEGVMELYIDFIFAREGQDIVDSIGFYSIQ